MDIAFLDQYGSFYTSPERVLVPFDRSGVANPEEILNLLEPFVNQAKKELPNFLGIGLSICGIIDEITGEAVLVANLYWRNVPIGRMAEDQFDVPILPATDVRMALIAEVLWGKAVNRKHVAWMTLGTGYGGYLFLNGQLYTGSHGFAGNLGHNIYDEIHENYADAVSRVASKVLWLDQRSPARGIKRLKMDKAKYYLTCAQRKVIPLPQRWFLKLNQWATRHLKRSSKR